MELKQCDGMGSDFVDDWAGKNLKDDTVYFILSSRDFHVGDMPDVLSHLPAYRHKYHVRIGIIVDGYLSDIAKVFQNNMDECIKVDADMLILLNEYAMMETRRHKNLKPKIIYTVAYAEQIKDTGYNIVEWQLGLDKNCKRYRQSEFHYETLKKAQECMQKYNMDKKSVILMPSAKSTTMLPVFVWERIADRYLKEGYRVYTNAVKGEKVIRNTVPMNEPIDVMASICTLVYRVISLQSGFSDLLFWYGIDADLTVLLYKRSFPDRMHSAHLYKGKDYFERDHRKRCFCIEKEELSDIAEKIWAKLEVKQDG